MLTTKSRWPSAVEDATKAIQAASKVMFLLYCMGVGAVGLALLGSLIGLFASGKFSIAINFMTSMVCIQNLPNHCFTIGCADIALARLFVPHVGLSDLDWRYQQSCQCCQCAWECRWHLRVQGHDLYWYDMGGRYFDCTHWWRLRV